MPPDTRRRGRPLPGGPCRYPTRHAGFQRSSLSGRDTRNVERPAWQPAGEGGRRRGRVPRRSAQPSWISWIAEFGRRTQVRRQARTAWGQRGNLPRGGQQAWSRGRDSNQAPSRGSHRDSPPGVSLAVRLKLIGGPMRRWPRPLRAGIRRVASRAGGSIRHPSAMHRSRAPPFPCAQTCQAAPISPSLGATSRGAQWRPEASRRCRSDPLPTARHTQLPLP
jgi:hypothetical protein